ncbi:copper resistance protein NlpE [Chitinophaga sp. HK235]|uniref:copper resistance protein NlpE n=1 Tax=Chitinophaga sp. HK235 TaxID=2952571 RepID=UPI001BAC0A63|nr:copper resistance protein NlpE [Chitinophaga sp. HK235]
MRYFLIITGLVLFACRQPHHAAKTPGNTASTRLPPQSTWINYTGTLPCADCNGILTTLSLEEQGPGGGQFFKLKEVYQGVKGKDQTFNSDGIYVILPSPSDNPDAVIIQLNPDKDQNLQRFYKKVGENELQQLDKDKQPIQSTLNYSLKKTG